jgi:hypothetical protein
VENHPFGLGNNVLGVLVQVQLRMVQIPESNGSIFSGDVWSEFIKKVINIPSLKAGTLTVRKRGTAMILLLFVTTVEVNDGRFENQSEPC